MTPHSDGAAIDHRQRRSENTLPGLYIINACSIAKPHAIDQLQADLISYSLDIAIIVETSLKKHHRDNIVKIDGYNFFRRDRLARRMGGVAVLVANHYPAEEYVIQGDNRTLELLWVKIHRQPENLYIGALYHPPQPIYPTTQLLDRLAHCTEAIMSDDPNGIVLLAGDFNMLPQLEVIENTGLHPLVKTPTRGRNVLDNLYVSRPSYNCIKVLASSIKTDHKAIVATDGRRVTSRHKHPTAVNFRRRTPTQHAALLRLLSDYDFNHILSNEDTQAAWDQFYADALSHLDKIYPMRQATMTSADPPFLTPEIKSLLRKKNRLMRKGHIEQASALAARIGIKITKANNKHLTGLNSRTGTAELWRAVNTVLKKPRSAGDDVGVTAAALNDHYAAISSDTHYSEPAKKHSATQGGVFVTEIQLFNLLDTLHHTAEGLDGLPAWFLRLAAPVYTTPLAYLINQSVLSAAVPLQWKTAVIKPVPKIHHPQEPADFRPISIAPILSRMVERLVVQTYIYPAFQSDEMHSLLADQCAFRPTGSTTAALIMILQKLTDLLDTNDYVTIIALDFSKAFDTVRHSSLAAKLARLEIPDNVYNWLVDYLLGRQHATKFAGKLSGVASIWASVVQGSGVGPSEYDVYVSDLHPRNAINIFVKFADDTYLIVGSSMRHTVQDELLGVQQWAETNNLRLNTNKSKEMIVVGSGRMHGPMPPPVGMERVEALKILGVWISAKLKVTTHVDEVLASCAGSLYALRVLRAHGLDEHSLRTVCKATTLNRILYAGPAWWGYADEADRTRMGRFMRRLLKAGFTSTADADIDASISSAELKLLNRVQSNEFHVLRPLFPPLVQHTHSLRRGVHSFMLPCKDDKNFISRVLLMHCSQLI